MLEIQYNSRDIWLATDKLSKTIFNIYEYRNPVILTVLKGGMFFTVDLMKMFPAHFKCQLETVTCSSYLESTESTERVDIHIPNKTTNWIKGRHILIVDDLMDTGTTITQLSKLLAQTAASVASCVLINKTGRRKISINPEYYAIKHTGDDFLVGYGMGYGEQYRHLPGIYKWVGDA